MDKNQLRDLISRVLKESRLYSDSAVELLMLTAAVESKLGYYIKQNGGPALGIFQMEPATYRDIYQNYLKYHDNVCKYIDMSMTKSWVFGSEELEYNIKHSILMARIHYLRVKEKLPDASNVQALAAYWKKYYNTSKGKGTIEKAIGAYERYAV